MWQYRNDYRGVQQYPDDKYRKDGFEARRTGPGTLGTYFVIYGYS